MKTIQEFFAHPKIQIALATGASVIILAYFSKRVLAEPLSKLELALPPFLAVVFEAVAFNAKQGWYTRPVVGALLVLAATAAVILLNA